MKKIKLLAFVIIAAMALIGCDKEDNPVEQNVNIDNPQEIVTDQPAYSRVK